MNPEESDKMLAEIQCSKSFCDGYPACLMTHRNPNKNKNIAEITNNIDTPIVNNDNAINDTPIENTDNTMDDINNSTINDINDNNIIDEA